MHDDEIRARYTTYIKRVAGYARQEYLRTLQPQSKEVPLEEWAQSLTLGEDNYFSDELLMGEERLSRAMSSLPLLRRQLLCMLFVEQLTALEIAERLGCSVNAVYVEKHRVLRQLRDGMEDKAYDQ